MIRQRAGGQPHGGFFAEDRSHASFEFFDDPAAGIIVGDRFRIRGEAREKLGIFVG
jgi:hypothetical protein